VVVDADGSESLETLASVWARHADWLLVGSGGLARKLVPESAAAKRGSGRTSSPRTELGHTSSLGAELGQTSSLRTEPGPVLVVAGSPSPMTRAQLERLQSRAVFTVVRRGEPPPPVPARQAVLVACTPPSSERDAGESAAAVADTVLAWSHELRPAALVLAGGATARLVCERLGATGVALSGELGPGIPIGRLVGGQWDTVMVVTKAGGFGTPTTLLDAVQTLMSYHIPTSGAEGRP
jgi:D-threonate/D-erythronate kinase